MALSWYSVGFDVRVDPMMPDDQVWWCDHGGRIVDQAKASGFYCSPAVLDGLRAWMFRQASWLALTRRIAR